MWISSSKYIKIGLILDCMRVINAVYEDEPVMCKMLVFLGWTI